MITAAVWFFEATPIWMSLLLWWLPNRIRRILLCLLIAAEVGTFAFATTHSRDGNPYQWDSMFAWMAATWLLISYGIARVVTLLRREPTIPQQRAG